MTVADVPRRTLVKTIRVGEIPLRLAWCRLTWLQQQHASVEDGMDRRPVAVRVPASGHRISGGDRSFSKSHPLRRLRQHPTRICAGCSRRLRPGKMGGRGVGSTPSTCLTCPISRGSLELLSADPQRPPARPQLPPGTWRTNALIAAVKYIDQTIQASASGGDRGAAVSPSLRTMPDMGSARWLRERLDLHHPCPTCRMGSDDLGRTYQRAGSTESSSCAGRRILPSITSGNLQGPTLMLAEKILDHIKGVVMPPTSRLCRQAASLTTELTRRTRSPGIQTKRKVHGEASGPQRVMERIVYLDVLCAALSAGICCRRRERAKDRVHAPAHRRAQQLSRCLRR